MRTRVAVAVLVAVGLGALVPGAVAQDPNEPVTIREIQYVEDPNTDDASPYNGQDVDCVGGVVVGKWPGFGKARVVLQDPNEPDAWGAIQVKDATKTDLYDNVNVGDWLSLQSVRVNESAGTTVLEWDPQEYGSEFTTSVHPGPLPAPLMVTVAEIVAPTVFHDPNHPDDPNYDSYVVENHQAERYESMRLLVRHVTVLEKDIGRKNDNYVLEDPNGVACWAADYMNEEKEPDGYHRFVAVGQHFCGVSGVFEQSTDLPQWDYYQLVTLTAADLAICGDTDHDGDVDLGDLAEVLGNYGTTSGATYEDGDFDYDGDVDLSDLAELLGNYGTSVP